MNALEGNFSISLKGKDGTYILRFKDKNVCTIIRWKECRCPNLQLVPNWPFFASILWVTMGLLSKYGSPSVRGRPSQGHRNQRGQGRVIAFPDFVRSVNPSILFNWDRLWPPH